VSDISTLIVVSAVGEVIASDEAISKVVVEDKPVVVYSVAEAVYSDVIVVGRSDIEVSVEEEV
jgi:hypothetical protein